MITAKKTTQLANQLNGRLIEPDDTDYDPARSVWNGMIDKKPALIARCRDAADVVQAVNFARKNDQLIAVRGGGHNIAGHGVCDEGLVIDLSGQRAVRVDPDARKAWVEPGATWADLDAETQRFGLAVPGGLVSSTGVAGLTLGGGFGWLSRKFGLTCDSLTAAEVVTAEGRMLRAGDTENTDLFWALRGGGGNFGVVTSFEFDLHEVGPQVLSGKLFYRLEDAPAVLRHYREALAGIPDELSCYILFRQAPPAPFLPEEIHGRTILALAMCYAGDPEAGEQATRVFRDFGRPLADKVARRPYTEFQQITDGKWQPGYRDYWKSDYLPGLSDEAIATMIRFARDLPTPMTDFKVPHFEGAISRIPNSATAFPHRKAPFAIAINTRWEDSADDEEHIAWTRRFTDAMQAFTTGGVYANFLGDEGQQRVRDAFGANYERLAAIKAQYDPDNFFCLNQNIQPA